MEFPKCSVNECEKRARSLKGGYCVMHYTRLRTHGDVDTNLYEGRKKQQWELPDGTIISDPKKIENLKIIIERIKKRRLLGYPAEGEDDLDVIEKVIDDYHGRYKLGGKKRYGKKTLMYDRYVYAIEEDSNFAFELGLIKLKHAEFISKIAARLLKSTEPIKFSAVCNELGIEPKDAKHLIKILTTYPETGIIYNDKEDTIRYAMELESFYELVSKQNKSVSTHNDAIELGLRRERLKSYYLYEDERNST